jgi:DNA-binding CsgD family transcriptional regulator
VANTHLEDILEKLDTSQGLDDLTRVACEIVEQLGVAHVVYYWVNNVGERFAAGTYSLEWAERYLEKDYVKVDPVVVGCLTRFAPTDWKDFEWSSKSAQAFLKDAIAHGVGSQGLAVPVRGPSGQFAVFTINGNCTDEEWAIFKKENNRDLLIIAHEFNKKGLEFEQSGVDMVPISLSPREMAAMTYLSRGLSRSQAAQHMEISEHTLRVYIETARHKLGALNTTHAVARALNSGLIVS